MSNEDLNSIFEQINNLKKPSLTSNTEPKHRDTVLRELLNDISAEIQRVMDVNHFTQEDLCRVTKMSQSNISKIQNGKVIPRIETLYKIAEATHTKLVISFESIEEDE